MKNKTLLLLIFSILFSTISYAQKERIAFKHLYFGDGEKNGLPSNHIDSVVEDKDGVLWICTYDGLVRYDSYRFVYYQFDPDDEYSISNNTINCFLEDDCGNCYVGTKIGFNIFDRKRETFKRFLHDPTDSLSISHNEVLDILKTIDGKIIIATRGGINIFDPNSEKFQFIQENISSQATFCLLQTKDGKIWAGSENGIWQINHNFIQQYPLLKTGDSAIKVNDLLEDSQGLIWVASDKGLYHFDIETRTYTEVFLGEKFKNIKCTSIIEYPEGKLFIGTFRHGLLHLDSKTGEIIKHYEYLPENRYGISDSYIKGLTIDHHQNLWISTDGGLNAINPYTQKFKIYVNDIVANSKQNYMRAIYMDARSNIWMNTRQGLYRKAHFNDEAMPVTLPGFPLLENFIIPSIWEDKKGDIWLIVNNEMLKEMNGTGRFVQVHPSPFFKNSVIDKVIIDERYPDLLWIATSKGICTFNMVTHSSKWILPSQYLENISDDQTRRITQQKNGDLWFTTTQSLCIYNPDKDQMNSYLIDPTDSTSLISTKIEDMIAAPDRIYIAGDKSFSYFDINKQYFINHTTENNEQMGMTGVAAINIADNGDVWFTGKGNTARFCPSTNEITKYITYNITSGCIRRCSSKTKTGDLLFGAKTGMMVIDPNNPPKDTIVPTIKISDFFVFNKPYKSKIAPDYLQEVNLNYYENYFTIAYTGFSYMLGSEDLSYYIKMDGLNETWQYQGYQRTVEYENINPGEYTFHVKVINSDGLESKPLDLKVIVHPPFWETYWFYSIIGSVFGLILYLLYSNKKKTILLKKEKKLAEQHAHYKSQFLANMSHEIRTPMNAIMGLNKLLMDSDLNSIQQEYTEAINLSCENLLGIINDILDQAKIENGNLHIKNIPFEIRTIARQINTLLQNSIKRKKLHFKIEIGEKIPQTIIGDPIRLFQVLTNLIGNAIKFTEKGTIHLRISLQEQHKDRCSLFFEVSDTGIGIAADKLKKIFQSFEQIENNDTSNFYANRGIGLGLSIAKSLVELQGGRIRVTSKTGKGSQFYFSLFFKIQEEQITKSDIKNKIDIPEKLKILLVEDTPINRFLAIELLKKNLSKVEIETAENGLSAVEKITSKTYDLVLMDIKMPIMNGLEATRIIRGKEGEYFQNIPILGLTANAIPQQINECFDVGMNECVTKPINLEDLLDKIALLV